MKSSLFVVVLLLLLAAGSVAGFGLGKKEEEKRSDVEIGLDTMRATMQDPIAMKDTMAMLNDPETMAEVQAMMKDPKFIKDMEKLKSDPTFQKAMADAGEEMQEVEKDPVKKEAFRRKMARTFDT
jgi:hypothetical protein